MISLSQQYLDVAPILSGQTVREALEVMEAEGYNCVPLTGTDGRYVGMVRRAAALRSEPSSRCSDIVEEAEPLNADMSPLDALALFAENDDDLLACVDRHRGFVGAVSRKETLRLAAILTASGPGGATIGVSLNPKDYSLTRIASIVEQCGVSILSVTTERRRSETFLLMKISSTEATAVCEALERHGYEAYAFGEAEAADESLLRKNYDELMMYLSV